MIWIKGFPAASDRAIDVVEWEFTGVFFDATEKIARTLLFVAMATFCVSCRTDNRLGPSQATPIIHSTEMSAREDCLYREVARLLEPKGSPPTSLHNIAATATRFCSEAIRSRFQRASVSAQRCTGPRERGSSQDRTACLRDWPGAAREPEYRSGRQLRLWVAEGSVSRAKPCRDRIAMMHARCVRWCRRSAADRRGSAARAWMPGQGRARQLDANRALVLDRVERRSERQLVGRLRRPRDLRGDAEQAVVVVVHAVEV